MMPLTRSFRRSLAASAVVGAMLPLGAAAPAHAAAGDPPYTGFSTLAQAAPVHVEIYEPTIPIPAAPQAEVSFGYSTVEADTGSSMGRASYLWPGDAVGEGFKTIMENLGLPPEISGPLAENGYPDQVNSTSPSGEQSQANEPFPGMVMRTSAAPDKTTAQTGYSTNCQVDDAGSPDGGGGGGDAPGLPGLPPIPALPGVPALAGASGLPGAVASAPVGGQQGAAASGRSASSASAAEPTQSCQIPDQLAALVDFGGYVSTSRTTNDGSSVASAARAALTDVDLLGGVITISGVHATSTSESDGAKGVPSGHAGYGTLAIAGQEFEIGPDGIVAAGQPAPIPGLPNDPAQALAQLGVTIEAPKPVLTRDGDKAVTQTAALVVTIDTHQLRSQLDAIPFDTIVGAVPNETGQLKSALGAAVHLSPKFVITLASTRSVVDTVQGIVFPTTPPPSPGGGDGTGTGTGGHASGGGTGSGSTSSPPATGTSDPGSSAPGADGDLTDTAPMGAGLPPLYSLPGALLAGGIALAGIGGTWLRKMGLLALGGAGSCPHGLDSGLPDLRKA